MAAQAWVRKSVYTRGGCGEWRDGEKTGKVTGQRFRLQGWRS
jgi:hypothetical protein